MKKLILFSLFTIGLIAQPSPSEYRTFIQEAEGYRNIPYSCSVGVLTVGIGHAFTKSEHVKPYYFDWEITELFAKDLNKAEKDAKDLFESFEDHPKEIQLILVSLSFNLGKTGLNKFVKFRKAIESFKYDSAAKELIDSKWFKQTGKRGVRYASILNMIHKRQMRTN